MPDTTSFADRFAFIMQHYNLSAAALAETLDVQRSGISHLLSGRNRPGIDLIVKVSERFPEISLYWLLKGQGSMLGNDAAERPSQTANPSTIAPPPPALPSSESLVTPQDVQQVILLHPDGTFSRYRPK